LTLPRLVQGRQSNEQGLIMNLEEKKEMLERQKAVLIQRQEEEIIKVHQLTGAIAILNEQLQEQVLNGKVKEKTGA